MYMYMKVCVFLHVPFPVCVYVSVSVSVCIVKKIVFLVLSYSTVPIPSWPAGALNYCFFFNKHTSLTHVDNSCAV